MNPRLIDAALWMMDSTAFEVRFARGLWRELWLLISTVDL
jgi:hypothetical protein